VNLNRVHLLALRVRCGFPCCLPPRRRAHPPRLYLPLTLTHTRPLCHSRCYACLRFLVYSHFLPSRWDTTSSGSTAAHTSSMTRRGTLSGTSTVPGTTSLCTSARTFDRLEPATLNSISSANFSCLAYGTGRGDVWWVNRSVATTQRLAYVNERNQVVMRVDNATNVASNDKRNSVRIESLDWFGVGSLWVVDISHVPYGCSVSLHAQPMPRFLSVTNRDCLRCGPHSGRTASCSESRVLCKTPPHSPSLFQQARNGPTMEKSTYWVGPVFQPPSPTVDD
jgi:hypothetical protein